MKIPSLAAAAVALLAAANTAQAAVNLLSWDEAYAKAKVLVDQMSLEQKVNISTGVGWGKGLCVGNTGSTSNPDFPTLCLDDSPLGIRLADNVTSGVAGVNAAASFDKAMIKARGVYFGQEYHGKGIHVQLGPCMNMMRSGLGGRGWESEGEDPYLTGVVSALTIEGIQSEGVIATAKHYILNEQELNRTTSSSDVDDRTLHEIYLWPFARSVEAGVGSVMCSYNMINGTYACEDDYTLNTVLKGELGFRGFIQSDWQGTMSTVPSVNSGLDMTMPGDITFGSGSTYFGKNLTDAVAAKKVDESRITDMTIRIVSAWYKMRQDTDFPETTINNFNRTLARPFVNVQANHGELVREIGAASTVLLKNSGVLPLKKNVKSVALVGSDIQNDPRGVNICRNHQCPAGHLAIGWGSGTADFPYLIDPLTGITNALGKHVNIQTSLDDFDLKAAAEAAKGADVAFVFATADSGEGENGDRTNYSLWNNGDELIKAVADANKNTVVVLHTVGAVLMPWINHPNIQAIVWPGLQGQESGNALADVLTGKVNPSGRLPYTIAKQASDYNADIDPNTHVVYSEKLLVGYKWFDHANIEPQFPFGHGLSYTNFAYSGLKVHVSKSGSKESPKVNVKATLSVKNSGHVDGNEVVQAYISFPASAGEPPKLLRGFEKVFIKKGKTANVEIDFTNTELSIWDVPSASWKIIENSPYTVHIGASSRDIRASESFTL